jgi:hypothetical protein
MKPEWMPENPYPQHCYKTEHGKKRRYWNEAFGIWDLASIATANAILDYLIAEHVVGKNDTIIKQMKAQLEKER